MGGANCPPVEATASTAAANSGLYSRASHEGQGEIFDELAAPAVFLESPEEHEQENIGGGHADTHAEEPLAAPEHVLDDAIP